MPAVVKVAIDSPLPQLDRLFDYLIPEHLSVQVGMRLQVPFGRNKKQVTGFAVELANESEVLDKLSEVAAVVSPAPVLQPEIYELCRAIADRQAATISDVLKLAVPSRSVRVENSWLAGPEYTRPTVVEFDFPGSVLLTGKKIALAPINHFVASHPGWVLQFVKVALDNLRNGASTIIVVPDFRDQDAVVRLLTELNMLSSLQHFQNTTAPSAKYQVFLNTLSGPSIVLGSRTAVFAPAQNLASILIFNDGDSSLVEPTSPYLATREIALIRQQQQGCQLVIAGHARSTEVQRLVEMNYLDAISLAIKPQLAATDSEVRVDSLAYQTVRKALEAGGSALIQVSSAGTTTSLFCQQCSKRMHCKFCEGPIGLDASGNPKCRWCGGFNLDIECSDCHSKAFRQGRAGVTRTAAEFGRSFAGVTVVEASGERTLLHLKPGKRIVVATVGAEPIVEGGYDAVVLLDAHHQLARDSLRSTENAVRHWADAISLLKAGGRGVLVGIGGKLGQHFALWNLEQIAAQELAERRELNFPPHVRMASVTAEPALANRVINGLVGKYEQQQLEILGPIATGAEARYILRFEYSIGASLAGLLKALIQTASAGVVKTNSNSGRNSRAVRLKMDDAEVV